MIYYVYILCSNRNGTLYIGLTNNLTKRINEHKQKLYNGFSKKYSVDKLAYFEAFEDVFEAINREKSLKKWRRDWKIKLIEDSNPEWNDLYYLLNS